MPVFDFNHASETVKESECTYHIFYSGSSQSSPEQPILLLSNREAVSQSHQADRF